jgi:hypothetical protein
MSICKVENGQKRKHQYPPASNRCQKCQHVTTHGANFRKAANSVKRPVPVEEATNGER